MRLTAHTFLAVALAAVWAVGAACGSPPPALVDALPPQLAIRSDVPYVGGRVLRHEPTGDGGARIHVRGTLVARASEAVVTVRAGTLVLWHDGRPVRPAELAVGRSVVVWTRDEAPAGSPPAVLADAVLVDGR
jgi:hypothetical protein